MEETRIDRLEVRVDELAAEMRDGFRAVDARLCKIEVHLCKIESRLAIGESRLDQCATKSDLHGLRIEMYKNSADMKTWMIATMVTIIAINLAAVFGLQHWSG